MAHVKEQIGARSCVGCQKPSCREKELDVYREVLKEVSWMQATNPAHRWMLQDALWQLSYLILLGVLEGTEWHRPVQTFQ